MKHHLIPTLILIAFSFSNCRQPQNQADAFGNFEATEVMVSAKGSGQLMKLNIEEGTQLKKNQKVGMIDTMQIHLKKQELIAQKASINARKARLNSEIEVLQAQKANAQKEKARIKNLLQDSAATERQWDEITGKIDVIDKKIESVKSQYLSINRELNVVDKKSAQIRDQKENLLIKNPVNGRVLTQYAEEGEVTAPGKPVYKIANLNKMILRAYVSGTQLSKIKIGQQVQVRIDDGEETYLNYPGKITWIADEAEFTPKMIQTKEERVDLVYAIKVKVKNDGSLKIGMPGEVIFESKKTN